MLRLPPFDLRLPTRAAEAAAILAAEGPKARPVAGGTDLWPNMKRRHQHAETVVGLMGIPELSGVGGSERSGLSIGATTTLTEVAGDPRVRSLYPALATAAASISSPPLRNMGTLGGNLCLDTRCTYYNQPEEWRAAIDYCMKEAGKICWVAPSSPRCWAHSASDTAPILWALGAKVRLLSGDGERDLPVAGLFRDDGIDYLAKKPEELLTRIEIPASATGERVKSAFWKLRRRGSIDFAVLSVAVVLWLDGGERVEGARVVLGSVGSQPVEIEGAKEILRGREAGDSEAHDAVAELARKAATPMDNTDFKAQWRGKMASVYTRAALRQAAGLEPGVAQPQHQRF